MIYKVMFLDGTTFVGGNSYKETLWKEIPDKPIKRIHFILPDGNVFTMKDYESFNHIIEATQNIFKSNEFVLRYQYLMGKKNNRVISYRIALFQSKDSRYNVGDITRREYTFGKEYAGKPTRGWKKGIKK